MLKNLFQNLKKGMHNTTETILEINLNHLKHNFDYLKSKLKTSTKFLAVVKAFAYGNDAVTIAKYLEKNGVDFFAVAYTKEGVGLRKAGITKPILVLHPQSSSLKEIIDYCLEPNLYNSKILKEFISIATNKQQKYYPVHIKFNTGLNRLGFREKDLDFVVDTVKQTNTIKVASLFSHLAASEDEKERSFTQTQINSFKKISSAISQKLGYKPILHICNTSGILNYPNAHFDMVRSGIGLYGFGNSIEENKNLIPIASLKSIISQIHFIDKGKSVGYNRAFKTDKNQKIATIPIGHADGIGRIYGNNVGYVIINNKKAPIVGNVCMDMIMVNISDIDCKEGDEVIIFDQDYTAELLAEKAETISYELITAISQRVKRIIIE